MALVLDRHIVMFVYNDAQHDSRVWRAASAAQSAGLHVTVVAVRSGGLPATELRDGVNLVRVESGRLPTGRPSPFWAGRSSLLARIAWLARYTGSLRQWSSAAVSAIAPSDAGRAESTIWYGHDLTGLIPAMAAAKRNRGLVVYDSHELFLEMGSVSRLPKPLRWLLARYENRSARRASAVFTVSELIADELVRRYRIRRPTVLRNCPPLGREPEPADSPLRRELNLKDRRVLIHHGTISEGRGIRTTVAALDELPDEVALVLLGDGELVPEMEGLARDRYPGRLLLHPAVPIEELQAWISGADLSVIAIEAINLNYYYSAPNKLFESMSAGVPVVTSDFPEMAPIVQRTGSGEVVDPTSSTSIAAAVMRLLAESTSDRQARRARCREACRDRYSWEHEAIVLLDTLRRVTEERSRSKHQGSVS